MKPITTAFLALWLAAWPALSAETNNVPAEPRLTWIGLTVALVIVGSITTCTILYVKHCAPMPKPGDLVTVVLEQSPDHRDWTPVATNSAICAAGFDS